MSDSTTESERELTPESIAEYVYDKANNIPLRINSSINQDALAKIIESYGDKVKRETEKKVITDLEPFLPNIYETKEDYLKARVNGSGKV